MALNTPAILAKIASNIPDNTTQAVTPALMRDTLNNMATSYDNVVDGPSSVTSLGGVSGAIGVGSGLNMVGSTLVATVTAGVSSIGGATGAIGVGTGLTMTGATLSSTVTPGVSSIGGVTGAITVGSGLSMVGSTLSAPAVTAVTSIGGVSGIVTLSGGLTMVGAALTAPLSVTSIGGVTGPIAIGAGLTLTGSTLAANVTTAVTSLGGTSGAIALGSGLTMVGSTLSATAGSGVTSIAGVAGAITLSGGLTMVGAALTTPPAVASIGGVSGAVTLAGGLTMAGSALTAPASVTSIGGASGVIALGSGLTMAGSTLAATGSVGQQKSVFDFLSTAQQTDVSNRARTLDLTTAMVTAFAWLEANSQVYPATLFFPPGDYGFAPDSIFYGNAGGGAFQITGYGAVLYRRGGVGPITSTTTADTTIPTPIAPGHLRGSCLYFPSNIYYVRILGLMFQGFRFAITNLASMNSPTYKDLIFSSCNCGVISYQTSQNSKFVNISTSTTNVLHIGSATCFPNGTAYANLDNIETDGLYIGNADGYGALQFDVNTFFDAWFRDSILRPTVGSYSVLGSNRQYLDASGTLYANSNPVCLPSGRAVYAPYRNGVRVCNKPIFERLDMRGTSLQVALINTVIQGLKIDSITAENIWDGGSTAAWFTFGAVHSGGIFNCDTEQSSNGGHTFIEWTNIGFGSGTDEYENFLALDKLGNIITLSTGEITGYNKQAMVGTPPFTGRYMQREYLYATSPGTPIGYVVSQDLSWKPWGAVLDGAGDPVLPSYATGSLPSTGAGTVVGSQAFDSTLLLPVTWNGSAWVAGGGVGSINAQTGTTYTFVLGDANAALITGSNASAQTYTIPPNSSVAFPVGTTLVVAQKGAGQITFAPGSGVTLHSIGGLLGIASQYGQVSITKVGTNEWYLAGPLA